MPVSRYFGTPTLRLRLPVDLGHAERERHGHHGAAPRSVCRGGEGAETVEMIKIRVHYRNLRKPESLCPLNPRSATLK